MAILYATGFEAGNSAFYVAQGWQFTGASAVTTTNPHRSLAGEGGDYELYLNEYVKSPAFDSTARWLHFWLHHRDLDGYWGSWMGLEFQRVGASQLTIDFYTMRVQAKRSTTVLATSNPHRKGDHWVAIELLAQDAAGILNVYFDGDTAPILTFTGDTKASTNTGWDRLLFYDYAMDVDIDDLIITDNVTGRLGERVLAPIVPSSDVAIVLTPTPGPTSYTGIDERPPSTAEYNTATAALQEDIYGMSNLGFVPPTIDGLVVNAYGARDGAITQAELTVVSGVTTSRSAVIALPGSGGYGAALDIWETDPNTGAAWLPAAVSAVNCGIRFS